MTLAYRIRSAAAPSAKHLVASMAVALCSAVLVFSLWYPYPYGELAGGRELFLLLITVDVICGPLLTFIVYSPRKPRGELWRDIGVVIVLQLAALGYGLSSVMQARPVLLAFEGDRFRVVSVADIQTNDLDEAPDNLRRLSLLGPKLIGVRLASPSDREYLQSIQLALEGQHPSFRPSRWMEYQDQRQNVIDNAKPLAELRQRYPDQQALIDSSVREAGITEQALGYLPLVAYRHNDWVIVVDLDNAQPKAFLPLDGWL